MITKRYEFGRYLLMTHLYAEPFWKFGFLFEDKTNKYNGHRFHGQVIGFGYHFSLDYYRPERNRLSVLKRKDKAS